MRLYLLCFLVLIILVATLYADDNVAKPRKGKSKGPTGKGKGPTGKGKGPTGKGKGPTAKGPTAKGPTAKGPTAKGPTAKGPTGDYCKGPTGKGKGHTAKGKGKGNTGKGKGPTGRYKTVCNCPASKLSTELKEAWKLFLKEKGLKNGPNLIKLLNAAYLPYDCFLKLEYDCSLLTEKPLPLAAAVTQACHMSSYTFLQPFVMVLLKCSVPEKDECTFLQKLKEEADCDVPSQITKLYSGKCGFGDIPGNELLIFTKYELFILIKSKTTIIQYLKIIIRVLVEETVDYKLQISWRLFKTMPCRIKYFIADKIAEYLNLNDWDEAKLAYLFFPYMHRNYCKSNKLSNANILQIITNRVSLKFGHVDFQCKPGQSSMPGSYYDTAIYSPICERGCGMELGLRIAALNNFNSIYDNIGSLKYCIKSKQIIKHITCANVDPFSVGWTYMANILSKCWPKFNGKRKITSEFTIIEVKELNYAIIAISFTQFKKIKKNVICDSGVLDHFKPIFSKLGKFSEPYENYIARKCYSDVTTYDDTILARIGNAAFDVSPKTFISTSKTVLVQRIDQLIVASSYGNRGSIKAFTSRFTQSSDATTVVKFLSSRHISRNINIRDFDSVFTNTEASFSKLRTLKQTIKSFHLRRYVTEKLFKYKPVLNYEDVKKNIKLLLGIDSTSISLLDKSKRLKVIIELCNEAGWNCKQAKAIRTTLMEALQQQNKDNPWSSLTLTDVEKFSPICLAFFATSDLEDMHSNVRKAVCKKIGSTTRLQCCLSAEQRAAIANTCFNYLDADDDGKISDEEASFLGSLLPYSQDLLEKLDETVIDNKAQLFRKSCLNKKARSYIIKKLISKRGSKLFTESDITKYGSFLAEFDPGLIKNIRSSLVDNVQQTLSDIETDSSDDEENDMVCCERDFDAEDRTYMTSFKLKVRTMVVTSVETEISTTIARKKRATPSLTCDNLRAMGSAVEQLSSDKLSQLDDAVFSDCLDFLGGNARRWSEDQLKALVNKLGDPCSKDAEDQARIGSISYGLSVDKLSCLKMDVDAVVQELGSLSKFSPEQLQALAKAFLNKRQITDTSTLDSTLLTTMAHIVGGLTTAQISKIKGSALKETPTIGDLKWVPYDQLKALADVLKTANAFGQVKDWNAGKHAQAGVIIGGLESDDMKSVEGKHIESWTESGVQHLPGSVLKTLTNSQLGFFSRQQALAISEKARKDLSKDQLKILGLPYNSTTEQPNGASAVFAGVSLIFSSILMMRLF
ncbi:DgyrCDS4211 [Dimorphilus gyrociliatus]|uniref:DgyrCDS4211 n=1 Tax=Dimorphilus gyrociliatus TaxID=2664684 RepID=A0A7I8VFT6_9ANNE|nr:DgyrCDS4211 [Dimorphilus gyrociliatus]